METLLRNDFTTYYGLPISVTPNISISTTAQYFEIEDDEHRETQLHFTAGSGMAAYTNQHSYTTIIINYDKFITDLPHAFQQGKERCDLVVYTTNRQNFLLNELKDRNPKNKVRTKSISQLLSSLKLIMAVPAIATFANSHTLRRCCFFNKQSMSPTTITATTAFNRLGSLVSNGLQMQNPDIQALGFEFWEYSGTQVYKL
jgi:hypothetical protein